VTPSQAKALWKGDLGRIIGCGAFACAYSTDRHDRVIKITNDRSDLEALKKGQGISFVPKVYKIYKLDSAHQWLGPVSGGRERWGEGFAPPIYPKQPPTVYAMEIERVRPLSGAERGKWQRRISCMYYATRRRLKSERAPERKPPPAPAPQAQPDERATTALLKVLSWMPKKYYPQMETDCCPKAAGVERNSCRQGVRQIAEATRLLRRRGIDPKDLHAGNIGQGDDGRWKLIDLGQSAIAYSYGDDPKALQGARRRR